MKRLAQAIIGAAVRLFGGKPKAPAVPTVNYKDCVHVRAPWGQQMRVPLPAPLPKKLRAQMRKRDEELARLRAQIQDAKERAKGRGEA